MEYVVINGKSWDDIVISVTRSFEIKQSPNSVETISEGSELILDPVGTYYTYTITFKRKKGKESEFDELYEFITEPRDIGTQVAIVYNNSTIIFEAFFKTGTQSLRKIDKKNSKVFWGDLTVDIIPVKAQKTLKNI